MAWSTGPLGEHGGVPCFGPRRHHSSPNTGSAGVSPHQRTRSHSTGGAFGDLLVEPPRALSPSSGAAPGTQVAAPAGGDSEMPVAPEPLGDSSVSSSDSGVQGELDRLCTADMTPTVGGAALSRDQAALVLRVCQMVGGDESPEHGSTPVEADPVEVNVADSSVLVAQAQADQVADL